MTFRCFKPTKVTNEKIITYHCNPGLDVAGEFYDQVATKCLKGPYYSHNASDILACGTLGKLTNISVSTDFII